MKHLHITLCWCKKAICSCIHDEDRFLKWWPTGRWWWIQKGCLNASFIWRSVQNECCNVLKREMDSWRIVLLHSTCRLKQKRTTATNKYISEHLHHDWRHSGRHNLWLGVIHLCWTFIEDGAELGYISLCRPSLQKVFSWLGIRQRLITYCLCHSGMLGLMFDSSGWW